ncbi:MAG: hypothetical protein QF473_06310 [Planctomycetota bacterium]|jgi:hypothetical protein|nr:hypothetical protein [Planctomycetota bacterium]MDP6505301.1 hypothetical protein [Planctomycetota bacterium]
MRQIIALAAVLAILAFVFAVILKSENVDPAKAKAWQQLSDKQRRVLVRQNLTPGAILQEGERVRQREDEFGELDMTAEAIPMSWKDLSIKWKPGSELPASVHDLHGKYVKLKGFILSLEEKEKLTEFLFLPSYWSGYFQDLGLTGYIRARIPEGTVDFTGMNIILHGRLSVGLETIGGKPSSVYRMEVTFLEKLDPFAQ